MPVFTLKCNSCKTEDDYIFSVYEDMDVTTPCSKCRAALSRQDHRVWSSADAPVVVGSTVVRNQKKTPAKKKTPSKKQIG